MNDINNLKESSPQFYDMIALINSIKDINKGWKIEMTKIGEQYNKTLKIKKS